MNVGVIGLGRMGKIHLKNLMQAITHANVVAVADPVYPEEQFRKEYGDLLFVKDVIELITSPDVDAIIIATPTSTHAALVEQCIDNDKSVFCEKPLDLSLEITKTLLQKAENLGVPLMIGFNRRFDRDFMEARKAVSEGKIGNPQIVKITNRDPSLPSIEFVKTSGGMFMDFTIHDFDMARYMMDKEVVEVYAKGLVFFDEEMAKVGDVDTALTTLTFADGTYAVLDNSRKAVFGYDQRLEIFGDKGMIQVENNLANRNVLYNENGIHQALPLNSFTQRYIDSYCKEMEAFIGALLNKTPVPIKNEDIIMATLLAYAAKKSMDEQRPVKIAEMK
ncbi:inositol 2-dehydrogenase [Emticicia sp. BO119]|nr:inositol 2-dehydrogenase [Emticicia sp. BO119]